MTYAAGLDAVTLIWIAKQFTEEHKATIDWLNRITDEKINFFGIEIEAYQIGDSIPAPLFQIVSKPKGWSKIVPTPTAAHSITDIKTFYLEYWTAMKSYFKTKKTFIRNQKPFPQTATYFSVGRSDFNMGAVISSRENFLRVDLYINTDTSKQDLWKLKDKYEKNFYDLIDDRVVWDEVPDKKMSLIYVKRTADIRDRKDWANQHQWFMETLEKFDNFFRPRIKQL